MREAKAMARLVHPNVVAVHDTGTASEQLFVAMEFVDGTTLRQWNKAKDRTVAEVVEVFMQAGKGLAAAHDAGIVHRDFKPDNVLVSSEGQVKVGDFGLVSFSKEDHGFQPQQIEEALNCVAGGLSGTATQTGTRSELGGLQALEICMQSKTPAWVSCALSVEDLSQLRSCS